MAAQRTGIFTSTPKLIWVVLDLISFKYLHLVLCQPAHVFFRTIPNLIQ